MRRVLEGKRISEAEFPQDDIVFSGLGSEALVESVLGARVEGVGRKGKFWWLQLDRTPWLFGHLGMSGWIRDLSAPETRLREHGEAPLADEEGRPRFLKMLLGAEDGARIAFTDGRRLGRLWLAESVEADARVQALGPDAREDLPSSKELHARLVKRKAPIKAILMDQSFLSGLGNWTVDEVLYQARISPKRPASKLKPKESERLRQVIQDVLEIAVELEADSDRFPPEWLFHHRWGGAKGKQIIEGRQIVREQVGGRTTAWVPEIQK
jgi:formamidopyrimidine-DNA glycosylase